MHYVIDPERGQSYALLSRVFFSIVTSVKVNDNKEDNMIIIEDYELPSWRILSQYVEKYSDTICS
jgi:hypothetical protein